MLLGLDNVYYLGTALLQVCLSSVGSFHHPSVSSLRGFLCLKSCSQPTLGCSWWVARSKRSFLISLPVPLGFPSCPCIPFPANHSVQNKSYSALPKAFSVLKFKSFPFWSDCLIVFVVTYLHHPARPPLSLKYLLVLALPPPLSPHFAPTIAYVPLPVQLGPITSLSPGCLRWQACRSHPSAH